MDDKTKAAPDTLTLDEALDAPIDPTSGTTQGAPHSGYDTGDRFKAMQGAVDTAAQTEPITGPGSFLRDLGAGATRLTLQPLVHPLATLGGIAKNVGAAMGNVGDQSDASSMVDQFLKNPSGESIAAIPQAVLAAVGGESVDTAPEASGKNLLNRTNLRPMTSPSVVPESEMAARRLSQAILPATKDATGFINAADKEIPNVLKYAREQGNPLNTQLEFSKAAEGSAKQAREFYENQVLGPNDKLVETTGTGFGKQTGEGPKTYAKLSDIDKRVVEINKQLDKPTLNVDDQRRALASKTELQAEARGLTDLLHRHLGEATGLAPEQIADLRQRVGRSYELSNDTNAAVTARMQGEGASKLGDLPLSKLPARTLEYLRGGPVAIADRNFQRAIKDYPGEATPLPGLKPIVQPPPSRIDALVQDIRNRRTQ